MQGITSPNPPENAVILQRHFKQNGYRVVSGGKVAHGNNTLKGQVDECLNRPQDVRGNFTDDKANLWGKVDPIITLMNKPGTIKWPNGQSRNGGRPAKSLYL